MNISLIPYKMQSLIKPIKDITCSYTWMSECQGLLHEDTFCEISMYNKTLADKRSRISNLVGEGLFSEWQLHHFMVEQELMRLTSCTTLNAMNRAHRLWEEPCTIGAHDIHVAHDQSIGNHVEILQGNWYAGLSSYTSMLAMVQLENNNLAFDTKYLQIWNLWCTLLNHHIHPPPSPYRW